MKTGKENLEAKMKEFEAIIEEFCEDGRIMQACRDEFFGKFSNCTLNLFDTLNSLQILTTDEKVGNESKIIQVDEIAQMLQKGHQTVQKKTLKALADGYVRVPISQAEVETQTVNQEEELIYMNQQLTKEADECKVKYEIQMVQSQAMRQKNVQLM